MAMWFLFMEPRAGKPRASMFTFGPVFWPNMVVNQALDSVTCCEMLTPVWTVLPYRQMNAIYENNVEDEKSRPGCGIIRDIYK
jgi:hypothetical protein